MALRKTREWVDIGTAAVIQRRNSQLRVTLSEINGTRFVNLRIWERRGASTVYPTHQGCMIQVSELPTLIRAFEDVLADREEHALDEEFKGIVR